MFLLASYHHRSSFRMIVLDLVVLCNTKKVFVCAYVCVCVCVCVRAFMHVCLGVFAYVY